MDRFRSHPADLKQLLDREIKLVRRGRYIVIPTRDETRGHATHSGAIVWKRHLVELLKESEPGPRAEGPALVFEAPGGSSPGQTWATIDTSVNISRPFIHRPVATTLLTLAVALAGGVAYRFLPVSALPQVDFPTISVSANLPGASRGYLPANLPTNPSYRKVNSSDFPIFIISLASDVLDKGQMYDPASTIMAQKLAQVQGVGQVNVGGSTLPCVRVELNPMILNKYGIGFEDVRTVLSISNANTPKGHLSDSRHLCEVGANDQLFRAESYRRITTDRPSAERPNRRRNRHAGNDRPQNAKTTRMIEIRNDHTISGCGALSSKAESVLPLPPVPGPLAGRKCTSRLAGIRD